ncbi:hypothetical protein D6792_02815 [Candidatus Parcubacteria bacterium]|nr:MAG: hypothetical protein D6792_02815 [Candidatus Parcubacteria bacterium]
MDWHTFFVVIHVVGTVLGTGGATFAEVFLLKALRDGIIEPFEAEDLKVIYRVLRIGFVLVVISGFGLLVLARLEDHAQYLYSPRLWAKLMIVAILAVGIIVWRARWLPQRVSVVLGSALSFSAWYAALVLGLWRSLDLSFPLILGAYVVWFFVVLLVQHFVRRALGIAV